LSVCGRIISRKYAAQEGPVRLAIGDLVKRKRWRKESVSTAHLFINRHNLVNTERHAGIMMRVLIIEDEIKTAEYLQQGLSECGYIVDYALTGADGLHLFRTQEYELVLLDVNLPEKDGWSILQEIRLGSDTRIIMLTASGRLSNKVKGLELGADDYLVKPFEFPELVARIRSVLRRSEKISEADAVQVADLEIDSARRVVYRSGQRIELTAKEFSLLLLLMRNAGVVMTRTQIVSLVWDINFDCDTNVVDVSIKRLRAKIDEPFQNKLIHTLRGVGYVLEDRQ